jgi:hypothetical protein
MDERIVLKLPNNLDDNLDEKALIRSRACELRALAGLCGVSDSSVPHSRELCATGFSRDIIGIKKSDESCRMRIASGKA